VRRASAARPEVQAPTRGSDTIQERHDPRGLSHRLIVEDQVVLELKSIETLARYTRFNF